MNTGRLFRRHHSTLFFILVLFTKILFALSNEEIELLAIKNFVSGYPGFAYTLNSPNSGKYFEMESALLAQIYEPIIGFSLDIAILGDKANIYLDDNIIEMRPTEYDVITQNFVIECKNSINPNKNTKVEQFIKEKKMLLWLNSVYLAIKNNIITTSITRTKKGKICLTLNGEATCWKDISIMSSWVDATTVEDAIAQWTFILNLLSTKIPIVFFKSPISTHLGNRLTSNGIFYKDNINYRAGLTLPTTAPSTRSLTA